MCVSAGFIVQHRKALNRVPRPPGKRVKLPALNSNLRRSLTLATILFLFLSIAPVITRVNGTTTPTTSTASVNLLINYGNGTLAWYNGTTVPSNWNLYNVTTLVTKGNVGSVFFSSFGSHFIYSINGAGCPSTNIFCDVAWGLWVLSGICWGEAQVGVDQVPVSHGATVAWFLTPASVLGQFPPTGVNCVSVAIDIKPGDNQTIVKAGTKGSIPVAILSTNGFDATRVNPLTVRFGRTGTEASPTQWSLEDVDGDGTLDLVLHFNTMSTGIQPGDTQATLQGRTIDTTPFTGSAPIQAR